MLDKLRIKPHSALGRRKTENGGRSGYRVKGWLRRNSSPHHHAGEGYGNTALEVAEQLKTAVRNSQQRIEGDFRKSVPGKLSANGCGLKDEAENVYSKSALLKMKILFVDES